MTPLDVMIEKLERRVKDDYSVFSHHEVKFLLALAKEKQNPQSIIQMSLNKRPGQGGEQGAK